MNKAIFIALAIVLTVSLFILVAFFGPGAHHQSTFRLKPDENTVLFAITPWGDPLKARDSYAPLLDYLGKKIGKKIQPLIMEDYSVTIDNIADGNIDIAVIPPVSFVRAKEKEPGIQYISTIEREQNGKRYTTYKGYLVSLKSKYAGWKFDDFLKNPKKYSIAFVSNNSSSGWAYPMAMMKKKEIDPYKAFKDVKVYERHPSVTDAIAKGKVDIGATWEYNLEEASAKYGDIFTIVYTTPDIPGLAWVASKGASQSLIDAVKRVQAEINNSDLRIKLLKDTPDKGWAFINENYYDEVREVIKYVGDFK